MCQTVPPSLPERGRKRQEVCVPIPGAHGSLFGKPAALENELLLPIIFLWAVCIFFVLWSREINCSKVLELGNFVFNCLQMWFEGVQYRIKHLKSICLCTHKQCFHYALQNPKFSF